MSSSTDQQLTGQTIALAGILQSAYLVDQLARTGSAPAESLFPTINSLFEFDPDSPEQVYGSIHGIDLGLRILQDIMGGGANYRTVIRYALSLLYLQRQLSRKPELLSIIRSRLEHAALKSEHFASDPQSVAASIAAIYQDTISTFKYRIQVSGSLQQLQDQSNANNIRALLLAGIRAAVLWRQMGGKRWHLFLSRGKIVKTARALLAR